MIRRKVAKHEVSGAKSGHHNIKPGVKHVAIVGLLAITACAELLGHTTPKKYDSYKEAKTELNKLVKDHGFEDFESSDKTTEKINEALAGAVPLLRKQTLKKVDELAVSRLGKEHSYHANFLDKEGTQVVVSIYDSQLPDGTNYRSLTVSNSEDSSDYKNIDLFYEDEGTRIRYSNYQSNGLSETMTISPSGSGLEVFRSFDINNNNEILKDDDPHGFVEFDGNSFGPWSAAGNELEYAVVTVDSLEEFLADTEALLNTTPVS